MTPRSLRAIAATAALSLAAACGAIYPRYTTIQRRAPAGMAEGGELTPPPDDVHRLAVVRAEVPLQTRDGRAWDDDAGPDAYVVVHRNGEEIFRSRTIQNQQRPEWDPSRDYVDVRIRDTDRLRVELREEDPLSSDPVGLREFTGVPGDARNGGVWLIRLEGGAVLQLQTTPPPAMLGLGVTYEYRGDALHVLSVEQAGPAYGAGLRDGDRITHVDGRAISAMSEADARQALDRSVNHDVTLRVARGASGALELNVRRDALYPAR